MTALARPAASGLLPALAAFAAMGLTWGGVAALIPALKAGIGASDGTFGLVLAAGSVGLVAAPLLAPAMGRTLGRAALPAVVIAMGLAALGPGLAGSVLAFGLAIAALTTTSALVDVLMNARVAEVEARAGRPFMNLAHGVFSIFYAVGAVMGGLAREAGWSAPQALAIGTVACLALSPAARGAVGDLDSQEDSTTPLPLGPLLLCGAIVLCAFQIEGAVEQWSALFIERGLGGRPAEGAFGPATIGLTMAAGRLAGQAVAARLGPVRLIGGASLLAAAGAAVAATAAAPPQAYLGLAFMGLGISVMGPTAIAEAGRRSPPAARTRAISRTAVIGFAGFLIGPPIMGLLSEALTLRASIATLGAVALLGGALALRLR